MTVEVKLTKREALRKSIKLWDWLAKTGKWKSDYDFGGHKPFSGCFLCEWIHKWEWIEDCCRCPLKGCMDMGKPYQKWEDARVVVALRKKYAKQVADLCRKALKRELQKG